MPTPWKLAPRLRTPPETPIVPSAATPTRELHLSRAARRRMIVEAQASGDRETGGGVYGTPAPPWKPALAVDEARGPGPRSLRWRGEFQYDVDDLEAGEHDNQRLCGAWHTHPSGLAHLSATDLRTFARLRGDWDARRGYLPQLIAAVVVPDKHDGWSAPSIHAWRMWNEHRGEPRERVVYEPLQIRLHGDEPQPAPQPTVEVMDDDTRRRYLQAAGIATRPVDTTNAAWRITPSAPSTAIHDAADATVLDRMLHVSSRQPRRPNTRSHYRSENTVMVALRQFTAIDAGMLVTVNKGERIYDPNHNLVRQHPENFKRAA